MNKKCLINIDTFTSSKEREDRTIECINNFKKLEYDILVTSHTPLSEKIQELADYVLYDKNNTLLTKNTNIISWFENSYHRSEIVINKNTYIHVPAVLIGMQNAALFAKSMNYEYVFRTEYDIIQNEKELSNIKKLVESENKYDAYLTGSNEESGPFLRTIFLCKPEYFINNIMFINNEDDYYYNCNILNSDNYCLEIYLGNCLMYNNSIKNEYIIKEDDYYFSDSKEITNISMSQTHYVLPIYNIDGTISNIFCINLWDNVVDINFIIEKFYNNKWNKLFKTNLVEKYTYFSYDLNEKYRLIVNERMKYEYIIDEENLRKLNNKILVKNNDFYNSLKMNYEI